MDNNNIKSLDLCRRCVYNYVTHCCGRDCVGCEMYQFDNCKCFSIRHNTPCPYFKEDAT